MNCLQNFLSSCLRHWYAIISKISLISLAMVLFMRSKNILCFALYFISISAFASEVLKTDFNDYSNKVTALNSTCGSKGMFGFSGFCLSKEYGKASPNNPTQTSITLGLEIASFEYFYANCEHSDIPSVIDVLTKSKNVLEAKTFFEEIKPQKEALENYSNRFYSCKTKTKSENDSTILSKQKWFDYMIKKYSSNGSGENSPDTKFVTSNKPTKPVVDCILSQYQGINKDFFATGLPAQDGSIVVTLLAPIQMPLAMVKNIDVGSVTQYINTGTDKYKSIPHPDDFNNAIILCQ